MSPKPHRLPFIEKVGYAMGDAAANLVWRGALGYLAIFYTNTLGLMAVHAAAVLLWVRLSDGITDIVMGMIADRTNTRWGKFRPWILWSAPVLGLFMILSFTTPDLSYSGKLAWAILTYVGLTLAYTVNNVPYSSLMGVMTPSVNERAVLSGYRFAGAFAGGFLVMVFTPFLVKYFGKGNEAIGYQYTMYVFAVVLIACCLFTFFTTKERIVPQVETVAKSKLDLGVLTTAGVLLVFLIAMTCFFYYRDLSSGVFFAVWALVTGVYIRWLVKQPEDKLTPIQQDTVDLLTNKPWIILLAVGFLFMMFNGIRYGVVAYYFKYYSGDELLVGKYFGALLIVSMFAAVIAGYLTEFISKKNLFILSMLLGALANGVIYFLDPSQVTLVFIFGCIGEIFAAIMPVLFFSMLGDAADYSEWKTGRRATGLVYSAGTFINKTGGGFAGALVLLVLAHYGYDAANEASIAGSVEGMKLLMSWIPGAFAIVGMVVLFLYPLTAENMRKIESDLLERRGALNDN